MSRHVVIGTAGHVDHGKTTLVGALTGVDTDRWAEEKRRGITIDLGFAPLTLGTDLTASIVDVPGHEQFVRNMVAGATGIDVALLVVAADEAIMPQTEEHLAILEFLGVGHGVAVLSKVDLVEADWLTLVLDELRGRLAASPIAWERVVPVSGVTGTGLEELRAALRAAAGRASPRAPADLFRLPVDRVFSVAGAGTVVTGTTWSGSLAVGDDVMVLPGGARGRVRSVEVHGTSRERAEPGRRTALAVAGLERSAVERGKTLVAPDGGWRATDRLDAVVRLLPEARALGSRSRVRVHLGTAEVLARLTPGEGKVTPDVPGVVRLRLEEPIVARWGDRGVLRAYSPVTTIGGFTVLDPWPPRRPGRPAGSAALAGAPPPERLRHLVKREATRGVSVAELPVRAGIPPDAVGQVVAEAGAPVAAGNGRLFDTTRVAEAADGIVERLAAHHRDAPLEAGLSLEAVRRAVRPAALASLVVQRLAEAGVVVVEGALARLPAHTPAVPADLTHAVQSLSDALRAARFQGATVEELRAVAGGMQREELRSLAEFLVRQGTATRVGRERYYDRAALSEMVETVREGLAATGEVGPAQLRERLGLTRKYLIPFLEWLDEEGITVRDGDVRRPGPRA